MDSGNSGSMQSSSGGDEDYDSRGESISTFLNNNNNNNPNSLAHFGSISSHNNNPPFLSHHHHHHHPHQQQQHPNNTFFDTPASLFPQNSNPQFNTNDLIWSSRGLRSDHNFNNFAPSSSSSATLSSSSNATAQLLHHHNHQNPFSGSSSLPTMQQQQQQQPSVDVVRASNSAQPDHQPNVAKNPKKRTRASRRAPTTVLTTDTTNFRQMVQEFTGIPTAPFTGSPYTRRLDLFSTPGRSGHLDSLGPLYPLRPSPQKVQVSPFIPQLSSSSTSSSSLLSSSMIDALMPTNNNNTNNSIVVGVNNTASASTSTSTNFQLGSNHIGISKQAQNLFNMQNQILSFNTVPPVFNTKSVSQGGGSNMSVNVPSLEELGISHEQQQQQQQVSANLISGFQGGNNNVSGQVRNDDGNNLSRLWRNNNHDGGQENQRLRSFDANNNNNNNNNNGGGGGGNYNKLNCSGNSSTSEFHPEIKGLENVCSTGEGPVSSWPNCPSD